MLKRARHEGPGKENLCELTTPEGCDARICALTATSRSGCVHFRGFNLGLPMRTLVGVGTPRGRQGRLVAWLVMLWALVNVAALNRAAKHVRGSRRV